MAPRPAPPRLLGAPGSTSTPLTKAPQRPRPVLVPPGMSAWTATLLKSALGPSEFQKRYGRSSSSSRGNPTHPAGYDPGNLGVLLAITPFQRGRK